MKIAIIGAGMAGLSLAKNLTKKHEVTVFEKSRGFGGRMSTRYTDDYQFDHGAQYFTARTKEFQAFLKPYIDQGLVQEWTPKVVTLAKGEKPYKRDWFEPHYVAAPKMNTLGKELAVGLDVQRGVHIAKYERHDQQWLLIDKDEGTHGPFDWVVCATPAEQAQALIAKEFSATDALHGAKQAGCFALMLGFEQPLDLNFQAAKVKDSAIGWICIDSQKPSRDVSFSLMVQSTNEWAEKHLDGDRDAVQQTLLDELSKVLDIELKPDYVTMHTWRYASTSKTTEDDFLIDSDNKLAACGDWCVEGKVEGAFLSAYRLAHYFSQ